MHSTSLSRKTNIAVDRYLERQKKRFQVIQLVHKLSKLKIEQHSQVQVTVTLIVVIIHQQL